MKEKKQHFRLSLIKHWMNIWWRLLTFILKNKAYWDSYRSVYGTDRPATWQNSHPFSPSFIHLREKQNEKYTKYEERVSKSSEQWELYVCLQESNIKCCCSPQVKICYNLKFQRTVLLLYMDMNEHSSKTHLMDKHCSTINQQEQLFAKGFASRHRTLSIFF